MIPDEILTEGTVHDISRCSMQGDILDKLDPGMLVMLDMVLKKVERKESYFLLYDQRLEEMLQYMHKRIRNRNIQCTKNIRLFLFQFRMTWRSMRSRSGQVKMSRDDWCLTDWMVGRSLQSRVLLNDYVTTLTRGRPTLLNSVRFTNGDSLLHNLLRFSTYDREFSPSRKYSPATSRLHIEAVCYSARCLLRKGCDPNSLNFDRETPLHCFLLGMRHMDILLNMPHLHEGMLYPPPTTQNTVLHAPLMEATVRLLGLLLERGADANIPLTLPSRCASPLCLLFDNWHLYSWQHPMPVGFYRAVQTLCHHNADVNRLVIPHEPYHRRRANEESPTALTYFLLTECGPSGCKADMLPEFMCRLLLLLKSHGLNMPTTSHQSLIYLLNLSHAINDYNVLTVCFNNGLDPNLALEHKKLTERQLFHLVSTGANPLRWLPIFDVLRSTLRQRHLRLFCRLLEQAVWDLRPRRILVDWAVQTQCVPRGLDSLCRLVLHESLQWEVARKVKHLPLPPKLQQYIMQI